MAEGNGQDSGTGVQDEDLVELEPDRQSIFKRILAPKVIILTFLSLMFISKNIYNIYVIGPEHSEPPPAPAEPVKQDDSVMERMYGYCILTVVLFVIYMLLVRANDRALMNKINEERAKKAQQQQRKQMESQTQAKASAEEPNQRQPIVEGKQQ